MTAADNAITTDQYIASNPLFLSQDNSLELPKQDKDTSVLTDYGYAVGSEHEDASNEALEQIQEGIFWDTLQLQMSKWLHGESPWDFNIAFPTFHKVPESLSTDVEENIDKDTIWAEVLERFDIIAQRADNWDGYESKSPNELSLNNARQFMNEFVDTIVSEGEVPLTPSLISSDEDGHITVEWHGEGRQLHLQIEENEVDYIQVWGPNIDTEMHVDTLHSTDYLTLWKWLLYGKK